MESVFEWVRQLLSPDSLKEAIKTGGYLLMVGIVFAETGLMIGFFLPGDSLMVVAGLLCAGDDPVLNIWAVNLTLIPAAIIGDSVGYAIGARAGPALFKREKSRFFRKDHLLKAKDFYERHGGKTIIIARFVPIIRTFAPVVAGIAGMNYAQFLKYNIVGGVAWVTSLTLVGMLLGQVFPGIEKQIDKLAILIIVLSVIPIGIELWRARGRKADPAADLEAAPETAKPAALSPTGPAAPAAAKNHV